VSRKGDEKMQTVIVCPAHGAVFDPANGFAHVSGPGQGPLTAITIQINHNGTVTAVSSVVVPKRTW